MNIGFMKDVRLAYARETFILDCRAAGLFPRILRTCRDVLTALISFTGDITVQELKPECVRLYIAHLAGRRDSKT